MVSIERLEFEVSTLVDTIRDRCRKCFLGSLMFLPTSKVKKYCGKCYGFQIRLAYEKALKELENQKAEAQLNAPCERCGEPLAYCICTREELEDEQEMEDVPGDSC